MILSGSDTSNHFPFGWYTPKSAVLTLKKSVRGPIRAQDTTHCALGSSGVVEPGVRAVGTNGIERCPPHVYSIHNA